jgi:hypothetical protein
MDDSTFVYELLLLKDHTFSSMLDKYITKAFTPTACTIDSKDIPLLVIKLIELLENRKFTHYLEHHLSLDETYKLFNLFRDYIISKIICEFDSKEFIEVYNNCIKLAVLNLSFVKTKNRLWLCS